MKRLLTIVAAIGLMMGAYSEPQAGNEPFTYTAPLSPDTGTGTTFGVDSTSVDTSEVVDIRYWESAGIQYRFTSGGDDSVDVVVHFQHSFDQTNWYLLDSTSAIVDSTYYYNAITLVPSRYFRVQVHGRFGSATVVTGVITLFVKGRLVDTPFRETW